MMDGRINARALAAVAAAAAAAVALAGCGASAQASSAGTSSAGAGAKVPLVVYSAQGYDSDVTKAFSAATGIPVKLVDDSTGPLLTKVQAERNNPQWGLLWVDGDTAFAALDQQGMLAPYTPGAALTAAGQQLVPSDHSYVPVSTTVMAAVIYNAARTSTVPASYEDLATAPYKGKVGMNDPSQSGPTFPFVAGMMNQLGGQSNGMAAGEAYFSKLKSNGLHVYPTNGDTLHALETGQIDYGIIQSSAAAGEVLKAKKSATFDPKVAYLPKATLLPGVIGIDKKAPAEVQAEAKQFVDYVLSPAGQKVMQSADPHGDSLYWPIVPGVQAAAALPAMPDYQRIDPAFWGPLEGQINTWFDSAIK